MQRRARSFRHAFSGVGHLLRTQPNAWIHLVAAVMVVTLGLWLQLLARDWAVLVLTITVVWVAEATNTALEAIVDLASPNYHQLAKTAKDVSAAAVLVAAGGALVVGLLILGPPLLDKVFAS